MADCVSINGLCKISVQIDSMDCFIFNKFMPYYLKQFNLNDMFIYKSQLREELNLSPSTFRHVLKDLHIETGRQKKLYPSQVEMIKERIKTYIPAYSKDQSKQVA